MRGLKKLLSFVSAAAIVSQIGFVAPVNATDIDLDIVNEGYSVTASVENNTVTIPVKNNLSEDSTITAYIVTYNNESLDSIVMDTEDIEAGNTAVLSIKYDKPEINETVKLYVWDENNSPIIKAVELRAEPTVEPTDAPTAAPTDAPTAEPTDAPTAAPTAAPTDAPTAEPTDSPTAAPTDVPTAEPTEAPTAEPTDAPTAEPTDAPTAEPTDAPTAAPTDAPTAAPTDEPTEEPTAAPTEVPTADPTVLYYGTPAWTVVSGATAMRDNILYADQTQTKEASVHIQGGGSGDRYAYATILPDGATADSSQCLVVDFYLNIAGANLNASHFYIMGTESKTAPSSGVIMDLAYDKYLGAILVNGTSIDNLPISEQNSDLRPTDEAKYNVTGLVHYTAKIDFLIKKVMLTIEGTTSRTYEVDFADSSVTQLVGFASLQGRALSGLGIADVKMYTEKRDESIVICAVTYIMNDDQVIEFVKSGDKLKNIPETDEDSLVFEGWLMDGEEELFTTEEISELAITKDIKFTAVYSSIPTEEPTEAPTAEPTEAPTAEPTEAPTAEPTGVLYAGTPTWTVVSGATAMRDNILYADQTQTKEASVHIQGGGSGDRYAYATILPDGATADSSQYLIVDFYLNIAGSNTNTSHFYIMGAESKTAPSSGVIMDLAYDKYIGAANVNGVSIDNLPISEQNSDLRPTDEAKYNVTGLVHYIAKIDFALKKVTLTIEGTTSKDYYVDFADSSVSQLVGFASLQGRALSGLGIADVNVYLEDRGEVIVTHTVTYVMNDGQESETVEDGKTVEKLPETELTSYIFKGWAKDGDTEKLLTTDEVKALPITADTTFTAVYEKDESYIEPLSNVEFSSFPENGYPTAGADANTAADNIISVKLTGELGTDLGENPDSRVTDMDVEWTFDGFRTIASDGGRATSDDPSSNIYCDSYAELKEVSATSVNFALKSVPFNFYGRVTAKVTYNGATKTISKPMVILGDTTGHDSNVLLPRAGYISDFDLYEDTMAGYEATISADNKSAVDIVTDNWAAYGGNIKTLTLVEEDGEKFMRLEALGTTSSCFASNIVDIPKGQVIISQDVRFYNSGSSLLYKSTYPVNWPSGTATTMSVDFNGTAISLNGGEAITAATTGVWYKIVMAADVTSGLCYAIVYDENGQELGRSETVPFADAGSLTPQYLCYRTPDKATGKLDFNNVTVYVPEIDQSNFKLASENETIIVPEEGEEASTTTLSASAVTEEGYPIIGKAEWTITDETIMGVSITPDADNSQNATLTVTSEASAGEIPIRVSIGGTTKDITVTLTSSKDSIKFTELATSISIPLAAGASDEYTYAANVINGDNEIIEGKTITYAMYDRNNMYETTVDGVTFDSERGVLTVTSEAKAATIYIRATSTNTNGETISKAVKVIIHGLAFDFGADTEDALAEGYTAVTDTTAYSDSLGYGISGAAELGGSASAEDADSDYLTGNFEFKVKVDPAKVYNVTINYSGNIASEYVNSDLSGVALSNAEKGAVTYTIPVIDDVLDLSFSNSAVVSSIVIEKQADKEAGAKPNVYTVGDSTIANNGSWAYVLARDFANYSDLAQMVTFSNNGRGGRNLSSYYTGGELRDRVLSQIRPGDYVMIGDMGTNGMGNSFEDDFNYYVDACIAMGAKVILNSYSPHGPMGGYESGYNSETNVFEAYRKEAYDQIVREIYEERKDSDTVIGFVDIGKNADTSFNAYVDDYAANGYDSRAEAANAIIACFGDHNHYDEGPLACQLMIEGYNGTAGIVSCLYDIITADLSAE